MSHNLLLIIICHKEESMKNTIFKLNDINSGFYLHLQHSKGNLSSQKTTISSQHTCTIYILLHGYELLSIAKGDFVLKSGDIFLMDKGTYFQSILHRGDVEYLVINFDIDDEFPIFHEDYEKIKEIFKNDVPFLRLDKLEFQSLINNFMKIFNERKTYPNTYNLKAVLNFIDLLFVIYDGFRKNNYYINDLSTNNRSTLSLILVTKKYIQENFKDDLSLQKLANKVNLSPSYLSRKFKEEVGVSLSRYIYQIYAWILQLIFFP